MSAKYRRLVARGRIAAIPVVAAAAVAAGAVGVASASAHKVSARAAGAAISKSELTKLKNMVTAAQAPPTWTAPGPKVNGKVLKGKTLVVFPISSYINACNAQAQDFTSLGDSLGASVKSIGITTNGGPPGWNAALGQAISDHAAAAVMLCGVINGAVSTELAQLKADGIPVVDGNYNETTTPFYTGLQGETAVNTVQGVQDDLADALVNLKGKAAHILYVTSSQVIQDAQAGSSTQTVGAEAGLKKSISKWCPHSCTIDAVDNVETTAWPTDGANVASLLSAHKDINTVIVAFDGESDGLWNQVAAAASAHPGLKIYAWGGGLAEEKKVQTDKYFGGDSGPDERWDAYDAMDQVIRLLNHKPAAAVGKEIDPNVFFTKGNVKPFFTKSGNYSDVPFGHGAFIKDFKTLWELG